MFGLYYEEGMLILLYRGTQVCRKRVRERGRDRGRGERERQSEWYKLCSRITYDVLVPPTHPHTRSSGPLVVSSTSCSSCSPVVFERLLGTKMVLPNETICHDTWALTYGDLSANEELTTSSWGRQWPSWSYFESVIISSRRATLALRLITSTLNIAETIHTTTYYIPSSPTELRACTQYWCAILVCNVAILVCNIGVATSSTHHNKQLFIPRSHDWTWRSHDPRII